MNSTGLLDAGLMARRLAAEAAIFAGTSTGANLVAALLVKYRSTDLCRSRAQEE